VNFLQFADGDLGVNLGRVELDVAEHDLKEADVRTVLQHRRGTGVPEQVARSSLAKVRGGVVVIDNGNIVGIMR